MSKILGNIVWCTFFLDGLFSLVFFIGGFYGGYLFISYVYISVLIKWVLMLIVVFKEGVDLDLECYTILFSVCLMSVAVFGSQLYHNISSEAMGLLLRYSGLVPFYLVGRSEIGKKSGNAMVLGLIVGCAVCLFAISITFLGSGNFVYTRGRFSGTFHHPNQLGIVSSSIVYIGLVLLSLKCSRTLARPLVFLGLILLMFSFSKTNIILVGCFLVSFILASGFRKIPLRMAGLFGVAVLVAVVFSFYSGYGGQQNLDYAQNLLIDPLASESMQGRLNMWSIALASVEGNWLWGIGYREIIRYIEHPHVHNMLLQFLVDVGLLGSLSVIVVFLYHVLRSIVCGFGCLRNGNGVGAAKLLRSMGIMFYFAANMQSDSYGAGVSLVLLNLVSLYDDA